jgi:hypothetical protein
LFTYWDEGHQTSIRVFNEIEWKLLYGITMKMLSFLSNWPSTKLLFPKYFTMLCSIFGYCLHSVDVIDLTSTKVIKKSKLLWQLHRRFTQSGSNHFYWIIFVSTHFLIIFFSLKTFWKWFPDRQTSSFGVWSSSAIDFPSFSRETKMTHSSGELKSKSVSFQLCKFKSDCFQRFLDVNR